MGGVPALGRAPPVEAAPGGPGNNIVEALIDDVTVSGAGYVCDAFTEPAALPPNPVGDTLLLGRRIAGRSGVPWVLDVKDPVPGRPCAASSR